MYATPIWRVCKTTIWKKVTTYNLNKRSQNITKTLQFTVNTRTHTHTHIGWVLEGGYHGFRFVRKNDRPNTFNRSVVA